MLPALSRVYGLTWADIEHMPPRERNAYLADLDLLVTTSNDPEVK